MLYKEVKVGLSWQIVCNISGDFFVLEYKGIITKIERDCNRREVSAYEDNSCGNKNFGLYVTAMEQ
jgi:hypothetical protein